MKFKNTSDRPLDFEIDGMRFTCDAHGSVEIHERIAYTVADRGLPLALEQPTDTSPTTAAKKSPKGN